MMASVTDVKFSKQELDSYTKSSNSCVKLERKSRVIFLLPSHFADLNAGVREALDSLLLKYDYLFRAIIVGYGKIIIQSKYGSICYGRSKIALRIEADFYLFYPEVGSHLEGKVCKQSAHHIGCLVHKAFNVSIPLDEDGYISGWDFTIGQDVKFIVVQLDLTSGPLPYIKGQIDNEEIKGKPNDSSGSQFGTDSGFDNGTEDDLDSETEEIIQESRPTMLREETGASPSKPEKNEMKSKLKKLDKKDVLHSNKNAGECSESVSSPRREKIEISKRTGRKQTIDSSLLKKGDEMLVNELSCTVTGSIQMCDDAKHEGKSESEAQTSGVKVKSRHKNKSRESSGKHDSLISELLKTMEMSFEDEHKGQVETPPRKRGKKRESVGSSAKKNSERNSQGASVIDIVPLTSVAREKNDEVVTSLDKPSIVESSVNESTMKTYVLAGTHGKTDEIQSPSKKVNSKKVLTNENVLSPSLSDPESTNEKHSKSSKEKTAGRSSSGGGEVAGHGTVSSGCLSPVKENENMIDRLLGMNEKILGVSPSSKKRNVSRKSTMRVRSPSHIPKVDEKKAFPEEALASRVNEMDVGGSNVIGNISKEVEMTTPLKKKGSRKSLTNNDLPSPSKGKRKSVSDRRSSIEAKEEMLLGGTSSEPKVEDGDGNVSPKSMSECEDIIGKLLSMKKKLLVDNVGCGQRTDSDEAKSSVKRKRKSVESVGGPLPKLKRNLEPLEKHPVSSVDE